MPKLAMIGDSHSVTHFKYLQPILEEAGFKVDYYKPKSGWSARAFITREDVNINDMPRNIDVAVVALGGNNHEMSDEQYHARLDTFIERLQQNGVKKIVWLGPMYSLPDVAPKVAERHDWTRESQRRYFAPSKWFWIDMYPYSQEGHVSDGYHFNSSQYKFMIDSLKEDIKKGLKYPYWLLKPRFYWIPLLMIAGVGGISYIGYKYYQGDDQWRYPQIS